jgi:hypothetical protein
MSDASKFQDLKARIDSYENLKKEFYALDVDEDEKIDAYIKLFQQFNDEFLDAVGELGLSVGNVIAMTTEEVNDFVSLAESFIGCTYKWGAAGDVSDKKGLCFDCSGFITYLMKQLGIMPQNASRLTIATIPTCGYFDPVPWNKIQRGDILCKNDMSHVVIYKGNNQIIHASNSAPYPYGGVKNDTLKFTGKAYRIKGYGVV